MRNLQVQLTCSHQRLVSNLHYRAKARQGDGPVLNARLMRTKRNFMYIHSHQRLLGP